MTALAGKHTGVVIKAPGVQQVSLVRLVTMAGLTGRTVALAALTSSDCAVRVAGSNVDATAGDPVLLGNVARRTGEIETLGGHVHVQLTRRRIERRIEIAVLHAVATAAVVMAGPAGPACGCANMACHGGQVDRFDESA